MRLVGVLSRRALTMLRCGGWDLAHGVDAPLVRGVFGDRFVANDEFCRVSLSKFICAPVNRVIIWQSIDRRAIVIDIIMRMIVDTLHVFGQFGELL